MELYKNLGMTNTFPADSRPRVQSYHQGFAGNFSTVTANPTIVCKRYAKKNAEQLKYIEVFRNGTRSSTVEDNVNFAGTYYYSIRGSGYFLPIEGSFFYGRQKNDIFTASGLPSLAEPAWEQDKPVSSCCISKGVEVFNVTNFTAYNNNEVIHNVDIITSLSTVIRMSPFDPRVSEINEDIFNDPYVKFNKTGVTVRRQFDPLTDIQN
jgi:hypothetical protein